MRKLLAIAAMLLIAGCLESLHPLYGDQDQIVDPALVGTWYTGNGSEKLDFAKPDADEKYKLIYTDRGGTACTFTACLLKLQGYTFLDIVPEGDDLPQNDFYRGHLLPTHTFALVGQLAPTLRLADMDYVWSQKFLDDNPTAVGHDKVDNLLVLTAPTADLQAFVLAHVKDADGPFSKWTELTRQAPPSATTQPSTTPSAAQP